MYLSSQYSYDVEQMVKWITRYRAWLLKIRQEDCDETSSGFPSSFFAGALVFYWEWWESPSNSWWASDSPPFPTPFRKRKIGVPLVVLVLCKQPKVMVQAWLSWTVVEFSNYVDYKTVKDNPKADKNCDFPLTPAHVGSCWVQMINFSLLILLATATSSSSWRSWLGL